MSRVKLAIAAVIKSSCWFVITLNLKVRWQKNNLLMSAVAMSAQLAANVPGAAAVADLEPLHCLQPQCKLRNKMINLNEKPP